MTDSGNEDVVVAAASTKEESHSQVSAPMRVKSVDLGDQNELDYEEDEENEVR